MNATPISDSRVEHARRRLADRLSELDRRVDGTKSRFDPRTWIANPWTRLGIAVAIGVVIGRRRGDHPVLRAVVTSAATAMLREALAGR